ncbi:ribonuclease domain-containing protein [Amycolatopsis sp. 195334CR]|uniref:ribonuclease domain-containing protein n=1 Tax=Amycolatopsis sp. 195334CR TaxID=2814588 RepID=UPI001A8CF0D1|nr:ribonuclease domain-containing protein [Amycolatopsis sp. 195334CR]MBN6033446.1 ribonuclease [Amycolatopsis sp. 195334CR]
MINQKSRLAGVLLAILVAFFGGATTVAAAPAAPVPVQAECGDTSGFEQSPLDSLPAEASETYDLIQQNGPYPYPQDDTVFQNRERLLPLCDSGYYREYTVETPGSDDRGARRIVKGEGDEYFYTADHYESFVLVTV